MFGRQQLLLTIRASAIGHSQSDSESGPGKALCVETRGLAALNIAVVNCGDRAARQ